MAIPSDQPYHSIDERDPDVHHISEDCLSGQQIQDRNRRIGTNGWPLCGSCENMQSATHPRPFHRNAHMVG